MQIHPIGCQPIMSRKMLYANGCSWTYGNGIEHDPLLIHLNPTERADAAKRATWPEVLAKKLDRECINDALGGGSNKRMVRTTCNFLQSIPVEKYKDLLVVLGWTTVDRNEIFLQEGAAEQWAVFNATQGTSHQIKSSQPGTFSNNYLDSIDRYQKSYISIAFNHKYNCSQFFQEMYLMSNLLENFGIKYMFFSSLPWKWNFGTNVNVESEFKTQIESLRKPCILNTRECSDSLNVMADFCTVNNLPFAPDHHTMVRGHAAWAEHLYKEYITLKD